MKNPADRYFDSKCQFALLQTCLYVLILAFLLVLNVFFARGLNERLRDKPLIVNSVNPGFCYSSLRKSFKGSRALLNWLMEILLARTSEQGSRQLIWACIGGNDNVDKLRGAYISAMKIHEPSDSVVIEEGKRAQTILWVNNRLPLYYRVTDNHISAARTL